MMKKGFKDYWMFIPIAVVILYYLVIHMKAKPVIHSGPMLSVTPSLDPGLPILNNIATTLNTMRNGVPGQQSSASINPAPQTSDSVLLQNAQRTNYWRAQ